MFRAAFTFEPPTDISPYFYGKSRIWHCVKCWPVVDDWASKAVDIDRRTPTRKKLRLLSQNPVPFGLCNPRQILDDYLKALPVEVKEARTHEARRA